MQDRFGPLAAEAGREDIAERQASCTVCRGKEPAATAFWTAETGFMVRLRP